MEDRPHTTSGTTLDETLMRENLRKARSSRGLTQAQVAESLDISVTAYQKIESGKTRILNPHFTKCASTLGVPLTELVNGFSPVKDAARTIEEMKESYGIKMKIQESDFLQEIQRRDREIERLNNVIKDKDETISTQKILINQLMGHLKD